MKLYNRNGSEIKVDAEYQPFKGKRFAFIGDSFSAGGYWQTTMCDILQSVNLYNGAISGARWSFNSTVGYENHHAYARAQLIVNTGYEPDVIMCCLGCNDAGNNVSIGEVTLSNSIDDFDVSTFAGGLQACINYLQNNLPNAKILIGWTPAGGNCNWSTADVVEPYIELMKEICLMYGVEYIETRTCGITKYSNIYADLWEAGTGGGHPAGNGQTVIGTAMADIVTSKV